MHLSDIKKYLRCPKMYQLSLRDTQRGFPFFNINVNVDDSIKRKLNITSCFQGQPNQKNSDTFKALAEYKWLIKARFEYRGLRIRIPVIENTDNGLILYFVLLSAAPSEEEAVSIRWNLEVLRRLDIQVADYHIIHLNRNYRRQGELDHDKLWTVTDYFYNGTGNPTKPIREYVNRLDFNIDMALDDLLHFDSDELESVRTSKCTGRKKCSYYDYCFPHEANLPDDSVLNLVSSQYKYDMYDDGIRYLSQVDLLKIEGTPQQFAQIMASRNGGIFYDKLALSHWLSRNITWPVSFLDFEWDLYAIPPYDGMAPLQVLPFQYSLHIQKEKGGKLEHYEYIGDGDPREQFIKHLLNDLPETGTILAYNAKGAEVLRIEELMNAFPEYGDKLAAVKGRIIDLAYPFINGLFYDTRMRGYYSLKVIQGIVDRKHSYHDLAVENGLDAVAVYRQYAASKDQKERQQLYDQLYEYCGLDSYAMYEVLNHLFEYV